MIRVQFYLLNIIRNIKPAYHNTIEFPLLKAIILEVKLALGRQLNIPLKNK